MRVHVHSYIYKLFDKLLLNFVRLSPVDNVVYLSPCSTDHVNILRYVLFELVLPGTRDDVPVSKTLIEFMVLMSPNEIL